VEVSVFFIYNINRGETPVSNAYFHFERNWPKIKIKIDVTIVSVSVLTLKGPV
jgi:hypothetical protein